MKVVYHPRYEDVYAGDPAAKAGRMQCMLQEVSPLYEMITPEPACLTDLKLVHSNWHIGSIQRDAELYEVALLAAGGAVKAAQLAVDGEPAFALVRPPGHHASPDHCWGFCFFNNMAISIARLKRDRIVNSAVILDIDLHFGDGTENIFMAAPEVLYFHPEARDRQAFVDSIADLLSTRSADVIAVSARFDRHEEDWGRQLKTGDYLAIGKVVKAFSERACQGRRYGVLEGGYNHSVLGQNVRVLIEGLS